jgi:tetratricopeptide (TPR) repeat protein
MVAPMILIIISLVTLTVIVLRHFSQITLLNVDSIPAVKQAKHKKDILTRRVDQHATKKRKGVSNNVLPIIRWMKGLQFQFRQYVGKVEREVIVKEMKKKSSRLQGAERTQEIQKRMQQARIALEEHDLHEAESLFISVIQLNPKYAGAYLGLGDVYVAQENYDEAEQSYIFALQINKTNDKVMMKLADLAEKTGNIGKSISYVQKAVLQNDGISFRSAHLADLFMSQGQFDEAYNALVLALELEPQNPKYLDKMVEISIMLKHKSLARDAWQQLRMVNPENQKLTVLDDRIRQLE